MSSRSLLTELAIGWKLCIVPRYELPALLLHRRAFALPKVGLRAIPKLPRSRVPETAQSTFCHNTLRTNDNEGEHSTLSGQPEESLSEDYGQRSQINQPCAEGSTIRQLERPLGKRGGRWIAHLRQSFICGALHVRQ